MARVVSVYRDDRLPFRLEDASYIRWLKVAEALARQGHDVDLATVEPRRFRSRRPIPMAPRLRRVPLDGVDWDSYDVVKTCFHRGFEALERRGGAGHPFIIAKLGSVVAAEDRDGIYFYGAHRERLWAIQCRIAERARYVTVLSEPARVLWREAFGPARPNRGWASGDDNVLVVPGGVDGDIEDGGRDPYPRGSRRRCVFAGNIYGRVQPEAHQVLIAKMNELGRRLAERGARLYHVGTGDTGGLDRRWVHAFGAVSYARSWAFLQHADVGVVLSAGAFMHNNESTKIYHYLRAGLPVVSESGFPNDWVVEESKLGTVVESGRLDLLAAAVDAALERSWDRDAGRRYVLEHHTWDRRCEAYREVLERACRRIES